MDFQLPELCMVVLIGPNGSGRTTFARKHFEESEIVDDLPQAEKRLRDGLLTVIDAPNVESTNRSRLIESAHLFHVPTVAVALDVSERICRERRPQPSGENSIRRQRRELKRSLRGLRGEGFQYVYILTGPDQVGSATVTRERPWFDRRDDHGPFDIIGDVHGCFDELTRLLENLGYRVGAKEDGFPLTSQHGRRIVFVGDLVDRGPRSHDVLRLAMNAVEEETVLCVPGNHDVKLLKALRGRSVQRKHGLAETLDQLSGESVAFRARVAEFIAALPHHFVFDEGKLVVAHGGLEETMHGRDSNAVRSFALYGDATGEIDKYGLPIRRDWGAEYRGQATVVYGHTPVLETKWVNGTIDIDTGCVFGGRLTALRYPEKELVSVEADREYWPSRRPLVA